MYLLPTEGERPMLSPKLDFQFCNGCTWGGGGNLGLGSEEMSGRGD